MQRWRPAADRTAPRGDGSVHRFYFFLGKRKGAALWSAVIATGGYFFGRVLKIFLEDIKHYELALLLVVLLIGIAI